MFKKSRRIVCFVLCLATCICCFVAGGSKYTTNNTRTNDNTVLIGGIPIGIVATGKGPVVTDFINIVNEGGSYSPSLRAGIQKGDVILSVNGVKIDSARTLNALIEKSDHTILVTILRRDKQIDVPVDPILDRTTNTKKIGIAVKENVTGIGTLTYVDSTAKYGALGHLIDDGYGNDGVYQKGSIFSCTITGYKKATDTIPGELSGKIDLSEKIGSLYKNTFCGIFGKITATSFIANNRIVIGNRSTVNPGKAYIYTTIDETGPCLYEIQIVKVYKQNEHSEKGMVIRIVDGKLLQTTGGILQGMSGSPIIQNGKLIGAVTHVFTNDTTMGYGIFIDWMLQ